MAVQITRFLALIFVALALVPAGAHLMELPNKMSLSADDYRTVQQIYRGWALSGIVVFGALLSTGLLAYLERGQGSVFALASIAFLGMVATQVIFWTFTFPVNRETANWTIQPANWLALRAQWEYAHAAAAVITLLAFVALVLAVLKSSRA